MPNWQAVLGFTSLWSAVFNLLAYTGLLVLTWGILDKKRQAWLFLIGGIMLWSFAVFGGDPIFIGGQTIILVASFMGARKNPDSAATVIFFAILTILSMYSGGSIDSQLRWLGVAAIVGLGLGIPFAQTTLGNTFFTTGGVLMAFYAYRVGSLPFLALNIIFTIATLWEIWKCMRISNQKSA
ncbi:MAG: hypothetical protein HYW89_02880 [Candidatus Sungiibacteriota bacterium]|uniref:Nicotinamide mononucleotide transporter n=1 Tax=Candidatus Sungiibacteriota bacterium TaxID=2750080 RepID=A0A7T5UPK2_9BACT|nr:MAG: hypothetical protein HYW89_02880 [Candidatus Sungbacteria bacterium]